MKKYARIQNGKVAEFFATDGDITTMFHPSIEWAEVTIPGVEIGYGYADGQFSTPEQVISPAQIEAHKIALVQAYMDAAAQALRYDNITTAITYAEEPAVPKFQAEGQAFRAWRSLVWSTCYAILDDVNAGNRGIPTDAELIDALPPLELPE